MLTVLHIRNLAVVEDVAVEFATGLNLLTGETGSGKSILVDGLALLFGARASTDLVRTGESVARVEGSFDIQGNREIEDFLLAHGFDGTGDLFLRREIHSTGRSRNFLNDHQVSANLLRELRPYLLEIHGQGEQQTLLDPETHLGLLDRFGDLAGMIEEVGSCYREFVNRRRGYEELLQGESDRLREIDSLQFLIAEIEAANPAAGEDDLLRTERQLLVNRERLCDLANESFSRLYDDENSALAQIGKAMRSLGELSALDSQFETSTIHLDALKSQLKDLCDALRDYPGRFDVTPGRLAQVEDRLADLERLKRKYGQNLAEVRQTLERARARLANLQAAVTSKEEKTEAVSAARSKYFEAARRMSTERKSVALGFETRITRELKDLALEHCLISFSLHSASNPEDETQYREDGIDRAEILISTNPGEELRSLGTVVSGGELSRIMLAIKTVCTPSRYPRSLVFDEIDSGIGGRVSEVVGRRLKSLATTNQVLCVTHQPQIARFADAHFRVDKRQTKSRTRTEVTKLEGDLRVGELARMLGGATITPTILKHAKELLVY